MKSQQKLLDRFWPYVPYVYLFAAAISFLLLDEYFVPGPGVDQPSVALLIGTALILPGILLAVFWVIFCSLLVTFGPVVEATEKDTQNSRTPAVAWALVMTLSITLIILAFTLYF